VNLQEYISSGIIESYVLGLASAGERAEFERMYAAHNEVRAELEKFELSLERQAQEGAITPLPSLRGRIFAEIEVEKDNWEDRVVPLQQQKAVISPAWIRSIAAAAIILLAGSTVLNLYFFSQYKKYISKYDELIASQNQLATLNQAFQTKLQNYESAMNMMKDTGMEVIKLADVPSSPNPGSMATVYWDMHSRDVYLLVNSLPKPVADKQYQLWAIVDGKPVDAGIFDIGNDLSFVKMKNIPQAEAFAITLEKKGGSAVPTMDAMYVMGKVTG